MITLFIYFKRIYPAPPPVSRLYPVPLPIQQFNKYPGRTSTGLPRPTPPFPTVLLVQGPGGKFYAQSGPLKELIRIQHHIRTRWSRYY